MFFQIQNSRIFLLSYTSHIGMHNIVGQFALGLCFACFSLQSAEGMKDGQINVFVQQVQQVIKYCVLSALTLYVCNS